MRHLVRTGLLAIAVLAFPGRGQAQIWPLQTGYGGDVLNQTLAEFDRLKRPEPQTVPPRRNAALPYEPAVMPAWTPPIAPAPARRPIRRAAAPRPAPEVAEATIAPAAAPMPPDRKPDLDVIERRLAERERLMREMEKSVAEDRRLLDEWRRLRQAQLR